MRFQDVDLVSKCGVTLSKVDNIIDSLNTDLERNVSQKVCFHQGSITLFSHPDEGDS